MGYLKFPRRNTVPAEFRYQQYLNKNQKSTRDLCTTSEALEGKSNQQSQSDRGKCSEHGKNIPKERKILLRADALHIVQLAGHIAEVVCREVRSIRDGIEPGNERRLDVTQGRPVGTIEPWVVLDFAHVEALVSPIHHPGSKKAI